MERLRLIEESQHTLQPVDISLLHADEQSLLRAGERSLLRVEQPSLLQVSLSPVLPQLSTEGELHFLFMFFLLFAFKWLIYNIG